MSSPVEAGKVYILHIPDGGVVSQVPGSSTSDEVRIRPKDGGDYQMWRAEANHHNFGFRSLRNDKLLGSNGNGDLQATATQLREWETFSIDSEGNQYRLSVNKDGNWKTVARPVKEDFLHLSDGEYTPFTFEKA